MGNTKQAFLYGANNSKTPEKQKAIFLPQSKPSSTWSLINNKLSNSILFRPTGIKERAAYMPEELPCVIYMQIQQQFHPWDAERPSGIGNGLNYLSLSRILD